MTAQTVTGDTVLHFAARACARHAIEFLLSKAAWEMVSFMCLAQNAKHSLPLHECAILSHPFTLHPRTKRITNQTNQQTKTDGGAVREAIRLLRVRHVVVPEPLLQLHTTLTELTLTALSDAVGTGHPLPFLAESFIRTLCILDKSRRPRSPVRPGGRMVSATRDGSPPRPPLNERSDGRERISSAKERGPVRVYRAPQEKETQGGGERLESARSDVLCALAGAGLVDLMEVPLLLSLPAQPLSNT
jgi:hypothetical protein